MKSFCWVLNPKTGERLVARFEKADRGWITRQGRETYVINIDWDRRDIGPPEGRIGTGEIHTDPRDTAYCLIDSKLNTSPLYGGRPDLLGKGYGAALYFAGAILAEHLGRTGVKSDKLARTTRASRLWERMHEAKLAREDDHFDYLDAKAVRRTGLIVKVRFSGR